MSSAGSTKSKNKATYDVDASVAALPAYWHGHLTRFRGRMNGNAADSTRNDYHRFAKHFIAWCHAVGLKIPELPRDTPFRYYEARGWVGLSASYGNMVTSGLRAFIEWSQQEGANGPGIPDLDFPASIRPPKRKPRIEGDAAMNESVDGSTVNIDAAPAGVPVIDVLGAPPPVVSAPPVVSINPPSAPAAAPSGYVPGVSERPLARQHVTNRRQTQVKDPLGAVMPQGGFIQLERVSDGTDGLAPGQRMDIGRYRINDIQGYNDFGRFVHEQVHPYFDPPLQRTSVVVYVGVRYDADERKVGAPSEIRVPNTLVAGRSNGNSYSAGPVGAPSSRRMLDQFGMEQVERGGSTGNPQVDAVMQNALQQLNRYNEEQMERNRRYEQALEEARQNTGRDRRDDLMFAMMHKPAPSIDINAVMDGAVAKISAIMNGAKPAPVPYIPPMPKEDNIVTGKLIDALTVRDTQPKQDPMALAERMVALTRPVQDPMVAALQDQNRRLEDMMRETQRKIEESKKSVDADGPEAWFKRQMMFEDMLDRRMARAGGGGADWATAINTLFDKLPAALKELRLGGALTAPEAKSRDGQPQQQAASQGQPQQQQELQASPAMNEAFSDLGAAFDAKSDQGVLTGVFKLITTIAQSPVPWPSVLPELDASIRAVETVDELQFVVQRLFMACLQTPISKAKPGIVRFIADVLAFNFAAVCTTLSHPVRDLPGVQLAPASVVVPPAAPVHVAASPTVTPRPPAPSAVPTPASSGEAEKGEDNDGDGETASSEEESGDEEEPIEKPETDGALGVAPGAVQKKVATA